MARPPTAPHPDAAQDLATALPPDGIAPEMPPLLAPDPEAEAREAALDRILFAEAPEGCATYLLIDAAADPLIATTLDAFPEPARCLFDGRALEELREVGPWLVELRRHGRAWAWFLEEGLGPELGRADPLPPAAPEAQDQAEGAPARHRRRRRGPLLQVLPPTAPCRLPAGHEARPSRHHDARH